MHASVLQYCSWSRQLCRGINLVCYIIPNVYLLHNPSHFYSVVVNWCGWVRWTCWNTVSSIQCVICVNAYSFIRSCGGTIQKSAKSDRCCLLSIREPLLMMNLLLLVLCFCKPQWCIKIMCCRKNASANLDVMLHCQAHTLARLTAQSLKAQALA